MCIIAVRKGDNVLKGMRNDVIGILDLRVQYLLRGETYPEELVTAKMIRIFKQRGPRKCGIISNVIVAKSAYQQGVASRMCKTALALYGKLGFTTRRRLTWKNIITYTSAA
ncbi:hypothetical protein MKW94_006208 [Papaver nudicaule]|uniref:N-acetyltransferase domain-containing protein n=1 Tax=Papaver nudicaule TaxID=74823 RepID=A0AA41RVU4_PAPNU|nr:hypothetical protein [Papaver nudicaule]